MTARKVPAAMREAEMNLLAAQTARFDEYRNWVGFRIWLIILMMIFLIALKAYEIYGLRQVEYSCAKMIYTQK